MRRARYFLRARLVSDPPVGGDAATRQSMMDVLFVALTVVFFLLSWLYVRACERA